MTENESPAGGVNTLVTKVYNLSSASDEQLEATCGHWFTRLYGATSVLRERFRRHDMFYEQRHWDLLEQNEAAAAGLKPVTPVLHSTIDSIHSDIMDSYPEATLLGEKKAHVGKAQILADLLKYIHNRRQYRKVWRDWSLSLLVHGTGVQEVFWDKSIGNGLGDVNVQYWSVRNFLWNPNVENIQDSEVVFKVCFKPREWVESHFPEYRNPNGRDYVPLPEDSFSNFYPASIFGAAEDKPVMVTEMWWKEFERDEESGTMQSKVFMAKFAGGRLLERYTNEPVYAHGMYPFVVTALFPVEGQAWGLGLVDLYGDLQSTIDRLDQIMLANAEISSSFKLLVSKQAGIDVNALMDWSRKIIEGDNIRDDAVRWFFPEPLPPQVMALKRAKQDDIKEESGQNAFVRGEGGKSVTAASAIMALQEAGSKRSRNIVAKLYDAFAEVVNMEIALIDENYTEQRTILISDEAGEAKGDMVVSSALTTRDEDGNVPIEFKVSVHIQKQLPYKSAYNDEKIIQLLQMGAIHPKVALKAMDFDRKQEILGYQAEYDQERLLIEQLVARIAQLEGPEGAPPPEALMGNGGGQGQSAAPGRVSTPTAEQPTRMDVGQSGMNLG